MVLVFDNLLHGATWAYAKGLQFDLNDRDPVDQQNDVISMVAVVRVDTKLVDHFERVLAPVSDVDERVIQRRAVASIVVATQEDLIDGVSALANDVFGVEVAPQYETLLTLVVLVVLFYGVALAKDIVSGMVLDGAAKRKFDLLIGDLACSSGKSPDDIRKVLDARYAKPGPVKSLVKASVDFFLPSMREGNRAVMMDHDRIEPEIVGEIPFAQDVSEDKDFKKFDPMKAVPLSLHAQDIDKSTTGWAAIPEGVTEKRLRLKLIHPVVPDQLWGKSKVTGDIVLISKLTAKGYQPDEIHLTSVEAAE